MAWSPKCRTIRCRGKVVALTPWLQPDEKQDGASGTVLTACRSNQKRAVETLPFHDGSCPGLKPRCELKHRLVFGHVWIDLVRPPIDSTFEVVNIGKATLLQQSDGLRAAFPSVTMNYDRSLAAQFV